MSVTSVQTDRLWLRPLDIADADDLHALFGDAEAMRFWHAPPTTDLQASRNVVAFMFGADDTWVFCERKHGEVVGHVGFVGKPKPGEIAGFGYGLRRDRWGRGYAVEAARAVLARGFDEVGITGAELWIDRRNAQSIRVAEKLGASRRAEAVFSYQRGATPSYVYGLSAATWRGEHDSEPNVYGIQPILPVADVGAAIGWWCDVIGFELGFVIGDPPTYAGMKSGWTGQGGVQLSLDPTPQPGSGHLHIHVADVDEVWARVMASGTTVDSPPTNQSWGMREAMVADADGNRIRLGSNIR